MSKEPKLEPKLVLTLSETKVSFGCFASSTASFGVLVKPKLTTMDVKQALFHCDLSFLPC
jgi:hypothetical protein